MKIPRQAISQTKEPEEWYKEALFRRPKTRSDYNLAHLSSTTPVKYTAANKLHK